MVDGHPSLGVAPAPMMEIPACVVCEGRGLVQEGDLRTHGIDRKASDLSGSGQ